MTDWITENLTAQETDQHLERGIFFLKILSASI